MKKEDLQHLEGKDIGEVINFADKLFKKNIEGKKSTLYLQYMFGKNSKCLFTSIHKS